MKGFTDFSKRKIFLSMLMDVFVLQWFTTPVYLFIVDMLESYGNIIYSFNEIKRKLLPAMFASWKFLPIYKIIVYSLPLFIRPTIAYMLAVVWAAIMSFV